MPHVIVATGPGGSSLRLGWRAWGEGPTTVLFLHGNLASKEWISLAVPHLPKDIRVIGIDWRGCGESDAPDAGEDYAHYTMETHARDILAALDALGVSFCHLATHSTGGAIALRMLVAQPDRFGKVLALDPVPARSLKFDDAGLAVFHTMRASREAARAIMATAAASLFDPASIAGQTPIFVTGASEAKALFERIVDSVVRLPDGILLGTAINLDRDWHRNDLVQYLPAMRHEHLILWGELDGWIPRDVLAEETRAMPNARFVAVPGIGHSMNLENPSLYAGYFGGFFGGLAR